MRWLVLLLAALILNPFFAAVLAVETASRYMED